MRDYTVGGPEAKVAEANGLVDADWYKPKVDRELMKQFMTRNNGLAALHVASWFAALAVLVISPISVGARGGQCPRSPSTVCFTAR